MKGPHLVRVEAGPEAFTPLVEAARAEGLRVGWLRLGEGAPAPPDLAAAAEAGVLRSVGVAPGGEVVAVKRLRGLPVLEDLLREHFHGCALVLVQAGPAPALRDPEGRLAAAPQLVPDGEGYRLGEGRLAAPELAARLRKKALTPSRPDATMRQ
ncbi:MAG TPA: hypothetical protein VF017_06130 [Thermoanaerobaculia bacterium]|nr:hypothetical protein [Thermoanaerobaculia bacterium]